jgi:hypothetical protein
MKINEFVENKDFLKIKNDIDSFLFYIDGEWMFADNKKHISGIIKYIDIDIFIKIGVSISKKLNKDRISIDDYDLTFLDKYFI